MPGRAQACVKRLTEDERASLKKLCKRAGDREIPGAHAMKLLDLGLAELNCGELGATGAGRVAMISRRLH